MADNYQRVYEVGLLDDIHNYFPALLYSPQSFNTVPDVLQYVQQRVQQRFNLFDYGRRQYMHRTGHPVTPTRMPNVNRTYMNPTQNTYETTINTMRAEMPQVPIVTSPILNTSVRNTGTLLPLLQSLSPRIIRTNRNSPWTNISALYEDVIIHATQEMINEASQEQTLEVDLDDSCAICQDRMRQGELVRRLTGCQHEFHRSCIDNWLLNESVICPTCRHDIRQPPRSVSLRTTPLFAAQPAPTGSSQETASALSPGTNSTTENTANSNNAVNDTTPNSTTNSTNANAPPVIRHTSLRSRTNDVSAAEDAIARELINSIFGRGSLGLY